MNRGGWFQGKILPLESGDLKHLGEALGAFLLAIFSSDEVC